MLMSNIETLLDIEEFLAKTGMSKTGFGRNSVNNGNLILQMQPETLREVEVFLANTRMAKTTFAQMRDMVMEYINNYDGQISAAKSEPVKKSGSTFKIFGFEIIFRRTMKNT